MQNKDSDKERNEPTEKSSFLDFLQQKNQKNDKQPQILVIDSDQQVNNLHQPEPMDEQINQILDQMQKEGNYKQKIIKTRQKTSNSEIVNEESKKKIARKKKSTINWQFLGQARETRLRKKLNPGYFDQVEQINPEIFKLHQKDLCKNKKTLPFELRKLKMSKH